MHTAILTAIHLLGLVSITLAQSLISDLSFGQTSPLAENNGANIPGFSVLGEGHVPKLMSDRVILTPPHPGGRRGALWADKRNSITDWKVELEFRASGPERAGGNLQLWYVASGKGTVSLSSIYTVRKFDGLALVIDTHGGTAGSIRGFLNDGTKDHLNDPHVDALAFGHCEYAYRNLGRPSKLTMISSPSIGLQVLIDDRPCFSSDKITLPSDYFLGITAASSEPPDSFEVFKLSTYSSSSSSGGTASPPPRKDHDHQNQKHPQESSPPQPPNDTPPTEPKDIDPTTLTSNPTQFADLHNRLQLLSHAVHNLFREITTHTLAEEARYNEILGKLPQAATMNNLDHRIQNIEMMISALKGEVEKGDHRGQFEKIHDSLGRVRGGVEEVLPGLVVSGGRVGWGGVFAVVVVVQMLVGVGYVVWKRRRRAEKKYL